MLVYNLQFFAKDGPGGEKTEPATQKKLSDARKEGQVAKSKEVGMALSLLSVFLALKISIGWIGGKFLECFAIVYNRIPELILLQENSVPTAAFYTVIKNMMIRILLILAPFLVVGAVVAFIGDLIQVKWSPTMKPLRPKFSKMDPIKGLKKIISPQSLIELLKSIVKILMISYLVYTTLKNQANLLFRL